MGLRVGEALGPTWADEGIDVVFVSRQLGHANPGVTLQVYAHLFGRREHADRARAALSVNYAAVVGAGE
jgi:integrase